MYACANQQYRDYSSNWHYCAAVVNRYLCQEISPARATGIT